MILLSLLLISAQSTAGIFDKDYKCSDAFNAEKDYDKVLLEEIFITSMDEAEPKIWEHYGGEDKFKSKAAGRHPVIVSATLEMQLAVNKVKDLCSAKYGYNENTLLSEVFVNLYKGKHDAIRDELKKIQEKKDEKERALVKELKAKAMTNLITELGQKCFDSINVDKYGRVRYQGDFVGRKTIKHSDDVSFNISKLVECRDVEGFSEKISQIETQAQEEKNKKEAELQKKKDAEQLVSSCKNTLRHSQDMTNPYKLADFFIKYECPTVIPEQFEAYKKELKAKYSGRTIKNTLSKWESDNIFTSKVKSIDGLGGEAVKFYNWLKATTKQ